MSREKSPVRGIFLHGLTWVSDKMYCLTIGQTPGTGEKEGWPLVPPVSMFFGPGARQVAPPHFAHLSLAVMITGSRRHPHFFLPSSPLALGGDPLAEDTHYSE
jgi:hypothetical protein